MCKFVLRKRQIYNAIKLFINIYEILLIFRRVRKIKHIVYLKLHNLFTSFS